jgi:CubicO group peptidase (beta-lactamase class C family)
VRQHGQVLLEHYADGVEPTTTLPSWSMAKSILHLAVGILVGEGRLALDTPSPIAGATLEDLLAMRDGLAWREDYVDDTRSDVQDMLWGAGRSDMAAFVLARPVAHPPGEAFCYSSGTSNVVSSMVADVVGRGDDYLDWLRTRVLEPGGLPSAVPKLDGAGIWVASSFCFAPALELATLGQRLLDGGSGWLPHGWLAQGTRLRSRDEDGEGYGLHWWVPDGTLGTFEARGYQGQSMSVVPAKGLVVVRLGTTPAAQAPALRAWRRSVIDAAQA